jgi:transcriptional regulator with XRE-family HTH domain
MEMKIGDKIRTIRDKEKNFTQSYVAEQLGITTKAYGNIENNISDPSYTRLIKIAEVLECDINYIINYQEAKSGYHNTFHDNSGYYMHQGDGNVEQVKKLYEELLESERKYKVLLEKIINSSDLNFKV